MTREPEGVKRLRLMTETATEYHPDSWGRAADAAIADIDTLTATIARLEGAAISISETTDTPLASTARQAERMTRECAE